jgi:hypothetical protein
MEPQMNADERRLKKRGKDLATDGAPMDTDEMQFKIYRRGAEGAEARASVWRASARSAPLR